MVHRLNTPGKTSVDVKIWEYVKEMCMFMAKSARSFVCCFSSHCAGNHTLISCNHTSNSFLTPSSCFPVTLRTQEATKLAVCLLSAVSQNMEEWILVPFHGSVSMGVRIGGDQCFSDVQRERQEYKVKAYVQTGKAEMKSNCRKQNKSQLGSGANSKQFC